MSGPHGFKDRSGFRDRYHGGYSGHGGGYFGNFGNGGRSDVGGAGYDRRSNFDFDNRASGGYGNYGYFGGSAHGKGNNRSGDSYGHPGGFNQTGDSHRGYGGSDGRGFFGGSDGNRGYYAGGGKSYSDFRKSYSDSGGPYSGGKTKGKGKNGKSGGDCLLGCSLTERQLVVGPLDWANSITSGSLTRWGKTTFGDHNVKRVEPAAGQGIPTQAVITFSTVGAAKEALTTTGTLRHGPNGRRIFLANEWNAGMITISFVKSDDEALALDKTPKEKVRKALREIGRGNYPDADANSDSYRVSNGHSCTTLSASFKFIEASFL